MNQTALKNPARVKINVNANFILIDNSLVDIPKLEKTFEPEKEVIGTIVSNLAYYGFSLSEEAFKRILSLDKKTISEWWVRFEESLKEYTGDNKNISNFVVYKNFPQEVLDMDESEYWFNQICMYLGVPNEYFTEEEQKREQLSEFVSLKVLHLAKKDSLQNILNSLLKSPSRWTEIQYETVYFLISNENLDFNPSNIVFKENMINIISSIFNDGVEIDIKSATDILRLSVALSGGDVTLKTNTKFKKFSRKERRFILSMMEKSSNLQEDMMRYNGKWKKLIYSLHPGDYSDNFPKVCEAYNMLYNGKIKTFNSQVESAILNKSESALSILKTRPGEFLRRLNKIVSVFGKLGSDAFISILNKLTVSQLLKIEKYIENSDSRINTTIAPGGNWTKLQVLPNRAKINPEIREQLLISIRKEISERVFDKIGKVNLHESSKLVKIKTNDSELSPYGRGTVFPIPENVTFIRTASYWKNKSGYNTWFDNGWNFFSDEWEPLGTCAWNKTSFDNDAAIFSGDPTNSKEIEGRACQMIDLYFDKLIKSGVRYAVWNILCFSGIKFNKAEDVFAALQWGEKKQSGNLFELSRCQLSFSLNGDSLTKYIAYIDLKTRNLVYMDANLYGNTQSAVNNEKTISELMPAFVEYLDSIPSVYDLFKEVPKDEYGVIITYDDEEISILEDKLAYVFKPLNKENSFKQLDISELLL